MKKLLFSLAIVFLATVIIVSSCKKKEEEETPTPTPTTLSISGIVYNQDDVVLSGVTITANGKTATTDANGAFSITEITKPSGKLAIYFKKSGFISVSRFESVSSTLSLNISMIDLTSGMACTTNFDASAGGTLTSSNANVSLPGNNFKDASGNTYSGNVNLDMVYIDPTTSNYERFLDGSSKILDESGANLESFGVLRVDLMDDNDNMLAFEGTDSMASIAMTIPQSKLADAPQEISLYTFDVTKSAYVASGTATKNGGQYVGTVSHFSSWTCAKIAPAATTNLMQYKLNGGAYQNQLFSNFESFEAYYQVDSLYGNKTVIYCSGADGTISFYLSNVNTTGTYNIDGEMNTVYINPGNQNNMGLLGGSYVQITKYGAVGGVIEGTFSGTCADTSASYSVNAGSFSIVRSSK